MKFTTRRLTVLALLCAISVALVYFIRFPFFPAASHLEYDPADIPILIGTFITGPVGGLLLTVAASAVQAMTVSAKAGWIGFCMHVFATGTYVIVAGNIYRKNKSKNGAVISVIFGTLAMTVVMIPLNLIFTPMYGVPIDIVKESIVPFIIPFNLLKASINGVITLLLYRVVEKAAFNEPAPPSVKG